MGIGYDGTAEEEPDTWWTKFGRVCEAKRYCCESGEESYRICRPVEQLVDNGPVIGGMLVLRECSLG